MQAATISLLFVNICSVTFSNRPCTVSRPISSEKLNRADAMARSVALAMRGTGADRPDRSMVMKDCIPGKGLRVQYNERPWTWLNVISYKKTRKSHIRRRALRPLWCLWGSDVATQKHSSYVTFEKIMVNYVWHTGFITIFSFTAKQVMFSLFLNNMANMFMIRNNILE